jgi:hypothetical protein
MGFNSAFKELSLPPNWPFRNMTPLTRSTLSGVRGKNGRPCGLLSFTDLSWRHFNTHSSSRVMRLGASRLWNWWRKPRCVAVTDCFDQQSTTAMWCCTDQRYISTKLQTPLYTMTVSMKATISWHAGFRISKTVKGFWCTFISVYVEVESKTTGRTEKYFFTFKRNGHYVIKIYLIWPHIKT